jgi:hypothetical protein
MRTTKKDIKKRKQALSEYEKDKTLKNIEIKEIKKREDYLVFDLNELTFTVVE